MGGGQSSSHPRLAGFRIVHLWKGSPAHLAGLELFFDNILEINGFSFVSPIARHPMELSKQIAAAENRTVKLVVFNSRTRSFRDVWVTPRQWTNEPLGLLGTSVRFMENVFDDEPNGLRVLQVFENCPASGLLIPFDDYLMGVGDMEFKTLDDLLDALACMRSDGEQTIHLSVYNAVQETVRTVVVHLGEEDGSLGCDVAQGLVHRLPRPRTVHPNSYSGYVYTDPPAGEEASTAEPSLEGEGVAGTERQDGITATKDEAYKDDGHPHQKLQQQQKQQQPLYYPGQRQPADQNQMPVQAPYGRVESSSTSNNNNYNYNNYYEKDVSLHQPDISSVPAFGTTVEDPVVLQQLYKTPLTAESAQRTRTLDQQCRASTACLNPEAPEFVPPWSHYDPKLMTTTNSASANPLANNPHLPLSSSAPSAVSSSVTPCPLRPGILYQTR